MRLLVLGALLAAIVVGGCALPTAATQAPPRATPVADVPVRAKVVWDGGYQRDIQPIFNAYCVQCHRPGRAENGLRLDTYEGTMKGTQFGAVVVPGSATRSTLVAVIQGTASLEIRMPHEERQLSPNRIQNVVLWIEAGAPKD